MYILLYNLYIYNEVGAEGQRKKLKSPKRIQLKKIKILNPSKTEHKTSSEFDCQVVYNYIP